MSVANAPICPEPGPLALESVRASLSAECPLWTIESVAETGSTNADLLRRFSDQSHELRARMRQVNATSSWLETCASFPPCARVAGAQTAGRGRLGRPWRSASGKSLLFSLGIVMPRPVGALSGLSLAIGLGVIDGLRALPLMAPERLGLKWPNDILLDDAKLGGILIETAASAAHACALVIGIGVNIDAPPAVVTIEDATLGVAPSLPAAHLTTLLPPLMRDAERDVLLGRVFAAILTAIEAVLSRFAAEGLAPFGKRWWDTHRFAERPVSIIDNGEIKLSGTAVGIDHYGRLLIDAVQGSGEGGAGINAGALVTVTAGDVSLRLTDTSGPRASASATSGLSSTSPTTPISK